MKCIIISLDSRPDRRAFMISQPALANCSLFPAAVVDSEGAERFRHRRWFPGTAANYSAARKLGLLGCLESHTRILRHFARAAPPPAALFVLEDDAQVSRRMPPLVAEVLAADWSAAPWDVLRFKFQTAADFHRNYNQSEFRAGALSRRFHSRALGSEVFCYNAQSTDRGTNNVLYRGASAGRIAAGLDEMQLCSFDTMLHRASRFEPPTILPHCLLAQTCTVHPQHLFCLVHDCHFSHFLCLAFVDVCGYGPESS